MPRKKKETVIVPDANEVYICANCGTKTFYGKGKCRWCYKKLDGSERVEK